MLLKMRWQIVIMQFRYLRAVSGWRGYPLRMEPALLRNPAPCAEGGPWACWGGATPPLPPADARLMPAAERCEGRLVVV